LGALGRLGSETCGFDFTAVIPCALIPNGITPTEKVVRGVKLSEEDFVVLWSGGYNVWSDVETLFEALETAMREEGRIHFVSTGGAIEGHDSSSYARFRELIEGSTLNRRFHLEGWVRSRLVPCYVAEADLGVLTEQPIYEGLLGSKNRIIQWMGEGLPVAYNRVGDLGDFLFDNDVGLVFRPGDAKALARHILWAAGHPQDLRAMSRRARTLARSDLSFQNTTRDLVEWARQPEFAPDASIRASIRNPIDHGGLGDRVSVEAQKISAIRRSPVLRRLWRHLVAPARQADN
jgi:glycosyltransferase involved in cell wall biosynthesis